MKKIVNECVGCTIHCIGSSCPYRNVPHWYCDRCGREEQLYYYDGEELCLDCIVKSLEKVE